MTIFRNTYDKQLYIAFKSIHTGYTCQDFFTGQTRKMTKTGRYSFKTLVPVAVGSFSQKHF